MVLIERLKAAILEWLRTDPPDFGHLLCDFDRIQYEIRPCDVLLIEGHSRASHIIQNLTQSPWSHAALYMGRLRDLANPVLRDRAREFYSGPDDQHLVIESNLGQGTVIESLEKYKMSHIRICRPKGISRKDAQQVISFAIGRLGTEYNVRHIIDLCRLLLPWSIIPRRWRSSIFEKNKGAPTREICSSMLAEAFESVHFPILPVIKEHADKGLQFYRRNSRLFTPRDFDYSPFFEIIKYPIIELSEHSAYRHLPWNEENPEEKPDKIMKAS
jgi:hypothetical protein